MHDEVPLLCVPDLPAQRLGNRVIDFHLRPQHFREAVLIEPQGSDGSQPPMTSDLSLSESAGSRSLDRLVVRSLRL